MKGSHVIAGIIGALTIILFLLAASVWFEPYNYKAVYLINPKKTISQNDSILSKELTCDKITLLKDLEKKGILLTPQEYISQISTYYSTLVAFLIGLFVLFSILSIYSIKITSKKEIEDFQKDINKREEEIKNTLKKEINKQLSELLRDSISFQETVVNAIYGRIQDELITKADKEIIDNQIDKLEENVNFLFESIDRISDKESAEEEIE